MERFTPYGVQPNTNCGGTPAAGVRGTSQACGLQATAGKAGSDGAGYRLGARVIQVPGGGLAALCGLGKECGQTAPSETPPRRTAMTFQNATWSPAELFDPTVVSFRMRVYLQNRQLVLTQAVFNPPNSRLEGRVPDESASSCASPILRRWQERCLLSASPRGRSSSTSLLAAIDRIDSPHSRRKG